MEGIADPAAVLDSSRNAAPLDTRPEQLEMLERIGDHGGAHFHVRSNSRIKKYNTPVLQTG